MPFFPQQAAKLTGGSSFTSALQTYQHNDCRRFVRYGELALCAAQKLGQFVVDDLDDLLTGSQALLNCFAQRAFFDIGNKIFNDFKVDVGFKQSHPHFAQRRFKIVFCYFAAAAEHF